MPAQPLIQSRRVQRLLIAALMCAVLAFALVLAWAVSGGQGVQAGGLYAEVPTHWQRLSGPQEPGQVVMGDPERPVNRFRLIALGRSDLSSQDLFNRVLRRLGLPPLNTRTYESIPFAVPPRLGQGVEVLAVRTVAASDDRRVPIVLQHMIAFVRDERGRAWVFHLHDGSVAPQAAALLVQNQSLFRGILGSVEFVEPT